MHHQLKRLTITVILIAITTFGAGLLVAERPQVQAQGSCPAVQNTPLFTFAYGAVTINGQPAPAGTVVEARSPRGDVVGCFVVTEAGSYGAMYIYGEDLSVTPAIPGMRDGETVAFFVDGIAATANPDLVWSNDKEELHQVDLTAVAATLVGTVTLQGRPAPPNPRWKVPLTVNLYEVGQSTPKYQFTPTTDDQGQFSVTGIEPATYHIAVKNSRTLQVVVQSIALAAGSNPVVAFGTLRGGDADDNNQVSAIDFSILATSFNKQSGDAGYDARADFNDDDQVSALDFSILATNFNEAGDPPPP